MELIELTENQINALTMSEVQEVMERIRECKIFIQNLEMKVRARLIPAVEKCGSCGATKGYLRIRTNGTYYCSRCGYSSGSPPPIMEA